MFHNFNSFLYCFITKVINEVKIDFNKEILPPTPHIETTDGETNNIRKPMIILPCAVEKGCTLINPHIHEIFLQRYCMKWVAGDPLKEMIN